MKIHPLWFICLLVRFIIVLAILFISTLKNKWLDICIYSSLLLMGLGFIYKYFKSSNNEIQITKVFWHDSRIYHGLLFV